METFINLQMKILEIKSLFYKRIFFIFDVFLSDLVVIYWWYHIDGFRTATATTTTCPQSFNWSMYR